MLLRVVMLRCDWMMRAGSEDLARAGRASWQDCYAIRAGPVGSDMTHSWLQFIIIILRREQEGLVVYGVGMGAVRGVKPQQCCTYGQ